MTTHQGPEGEALAAARDRGVPAERVNPVFRLADTPSARQAAAPPEPEVADLLARHVTSPAVLVLAVTQGEDTHRIRIGVDLEHPSVETSDLTAPGDPGDPAPVSRWRSVEPGELLAAVESALPREESFTAPPRLAVREDAEILSLTPAQRAEVGRRLEQGDDPESAFARIEDLDPALRDALLARGPRVSLSLMLHDASGRVAPDPVPWARVWVRGELGLYRADPDPGGELIVTPVAAGDVLGTAVAILQEAMRFTAAVRAAGSRDGGAR